MDPDTSASARDVGSVSGPRGFHRAQGSWECRHDHWVCTLWACDLTREGTARMSQAPDLESYPCSAARESPRTTTKTHTAINKYIFLKYPNKKLINNKELVFNNSLLFKASTQVVRFFFFFILKVPSKETTFIGTILISPNQQRHHVLLVWCMRHLQKSVCECVPAFVCGHEGIATVLKTYLFYLWKSKHLRVAQGKVSNLPITAVSDSNTSRTTKLLSWWNNRLIEFPFAL